jgi:putative membrane-bound dehydrogenase-like protein
MRPTHLATAVLLALALNLSAAEPPPYRVGVAQIEITPDYPIRLAGFGFRRAESEGVSLPIHAKALAIDDVEPAVLITADLCGVPATFTDELAKRLQAAGVKRDRFMLTVTHTHTAPMVKGYLPTLFGVPIPAEHQQHIDRFTRELLDKLERVAKAALADRKPAKLSWGVGSVGFAMNRRDKGGPVDHDLPVIVVRDLDGKVRAVYASYACHCVTLSNNKISGDWAGFAQEAIQADFPGAIALISIGCGADQNPDSGVTGDKVDVATAQGRAFAHEVRRLVNGWLAPITDKLTANASEFDLPLIDPPPRAAWEEKVKQNRPESRSYAIGYHARVQLDRLDRGESLPTKVPYRVQTWTFGDDLAMAFLPGEVVVDYSLRLKRELDARRLWINAYSNNVPCYIPSERVLKEGRYEGGGAMVYYALPGPFKPGLEQPIVDAVKKLIGDRYRAPYAADKTGGTKALSPQQSLAAIKMRPGMVAELVAAEPLTTDPVAIDWGPDGCMYVCEMHDYPLGSDGQFRPAGRIRVLRNTDGDGRYHRSEIFLDNIPFPTGVTVWRNGVLVCAAPDILYAEDTDGDGKADVVKKLFTGFGTHNYQARVNSLEYGLDGWVYGASGLFGGTITSFTGAKYEIGNRDFRIKPDTGEIEATTGRTQQGRPRDDWGNWFGCENMTLARHYPLADDALRRNPHVPPPNPFVVVTRGHAADKLFPINPKMQLFKLSGPPGLPTAVCGLGVYRDDLLGRDVTGDLFSCEPVNLLVTRRKLDPKGSTFTSHRVEGETDSEFLASTDAWFRPVQARTGPDGCLYVVDMYRCVIEHPRWIPAEDAAKLDMRAGSTMGRIYRVRPTDKSPRPLTRLNRLDTAGLVAALDSSNGWQRDLATQMLLWRNDTTAAALLGKLASGSPRAEARLQALCTLDGLGKVDTNSVVRALHDQHAGVRRQAVRIAGNLQPAATGLGSLLAGLVNDSDPQVRLQLACALGHWADPAAGRGLIELAERDSGDAYLTAAVLSSLNEKNIAAALDAARESIARQAPGSVLTGLLATAVALDQREPAAAFLRAASTSRDGDIKSWQMSALAALIDAVERRGQPLEKWLDQATVTAARGLIENARAAALDEAKVLPDRLAAVALLNRDPARREADGKTLAELLTPRHPAALQAAAVTALARDSGDATARRVIAGWGGYSPVLRTQILDILLSRGAWQRQLMAALEAQQIPAGEIDIPRRQRLLAHRDAAVRERAAKLFAGSVRADRQKVLQDFQDILHLSGDRARGQAAFVKHCSVCHRLHDTGHAVGPDLGAMATKTPAYLLQEILDPNRNVDSRFVEYRATLKDGRQFAGLLAAESATGITLRAQEGRDQTILRKDLDELQGTGRSLMPEGLEQQMSRQDLADVIAYVTADSPNPATATPAELARVLLDDSRPAAERQALVGNTTSRAAEVVSAMAADMPADAKEEYRRIPWIWRVSVAAGKRNDPNELKKLLEVSLPERDQPLHHWQAVVLGGGIINGLSQRGLWPRPRIAELLRDDTALIARARQTLEQAATMADDAKVPTGTRYDALRIVAMDSWEKRGEQLCKYLARGTNAELQMGAISGLSDLDAPPIAEKLLSGIDYYSPTNRGLAFDALLRTDARTTSLLDALQEGRVPVALLGETQKQALRNHANTKLRERALRLLK